jgi:hypothetical protein
MWGLNETLVLLVALILLAEMELQRFGNRRATIILGVILAIISGYFGHLYLSASLTGCTMLFLVDGITIGYRIRF